MSRKKSAPAWQSSLPSGESDPSVTLDSVGAVGVRVEKADNLERSQDEPRDAVGLSYRPVTPSTHPDSRP
jgi:hypothetical protein